MIPIIASIIDDVQVRNVELLVNGLVVRNDVSFPFDFASLGVGTDPDAPVVTIQVRVTDTGGNTALSDLLTIDLIPDTFAPSVVSIDPPDGATRLTGRRTIRILFDESLDAGSVTSSNFQLRDSFGALINPLDIQLRADERLVQVTYQGLLGGEYEFIIVGPGVTDRAGNSLGSSNIVSQFTLVEPGDIISTAVDTGFTSTDSGTYRVSERIGDNLALPPRLDVDMFTFELSADGSVEVINYNPSSPFLRIFSSAGLEVASGIGAVSFTATFTDRYYVGISDEANSTYDPILNSSTPDRL